MVKINHFLSDDLFQLGENGTIHFQLENQREEAELFHLAWALFLIEDGRGGKVKVADSADPAGWGVSFVNTQGGTVYTEQDDMDRITIALDVGESLSLELRLTPPQDISGAGDYLLNISAVSDILEELMGGDEHEFTLRTHPDLWITADDIVLDPAEVDEGKKVTISVTVHLSGAISQDLSIGFYYFELEEGYILMGERVLNFEDEVGEDVTKLVHFNWEAEALWHVTDNIRVEVDPENAIVEEDEENNVAGVKLLVTAKETEEDGGFLPGFELVAVVVVLVVWVSFKKRKN